MLLVMVFFSKKIFWFPILLKKIFWFWWRKKIIWFRVFANEFEKKKNILTLVMSEKKTHTPPPYKLNGRSLTWPVQYWNIDTDFTYFRIIQERILPHRAWTVLKSHKQLRTQCQYVVSLCALVKENEHELLFLTFETGQFLFLAMWDFLILH